ncbi:hypothetical protein MMC12_002495 [Toensbergia leucococca]|nr:hypothetical protein [Toensbergia leucococca]
MALYVDETDSRRPGPPTSLVLDTLNSDGDILSMSVGFADGRFSIYSLQKILRTFTHRYTHPPSINGMISAIAYASPYILTMTEARLLSLYTFGTKIMKIDCALSSPRLLSSLKSHTAWPPLSLSIRVSSASIVASIAYAIPTYLSGWSVGLQELRLGPEGDILESRLATALNQGFTPLHSPSSGMSSPNLGGGSSPIKGMYSNMISHSTRPTSLSYTHPYLLASHPDNTLTLYMVTSTAENLFVGAGNRLWGHTSSVSGAHVGDRGKAVSISTHGNEIRIWELEGGTASSLSSRRQAPAKVSVQIRPERNSSVNRGLQETTEQRGTCLELSPEHVADELEIARGWVAFDEEKVIVLREKDQGAQALFVYDFS